MDNSTNWSKRLPNWIPDLVFLVFGVGITAWALAKKIRTIGSRFCVLRLALFLRVLVSFRFCCDTNFQNLQKA